MSSLDKRRTDSYVALTLHGSSDVQHFYVFQPRFCRGKGLESFEASWCLRTTYIILCSDRYILFGGAFRHSKQIMVPPGSFFVDMASGGLHELT